MSHITGKREIRFIAKVIDYIHIFNKNLEQLDNMDISS